MTQMKPAEVEASVRHADDDLVFSDEEPHDHSAEARTWKVLIVDDDHDVHNVTRLALLDFAFQGRSLALLSAYDSAQAKLLLKDHPDIALILLDVVMESEDAGLMLVRHIREELKNSMVRIVLRTGQPGQAPENQVIVDYDINDYKNKTELTAERLFTTMVASLRSYRDLETIDLNKRGLEKIIASSARLFEQQSFETFIVGVLTQLTSILRIDESSIYCHTSTFFTSKANGDLTIVAGTGAYADQCNKNVTQVLPAAIVDVICEAIGKRENIYRERYAAIYVRSKTGADNVIYLETETALSKIDRQLVEIFCTNISAAFDIMRLNEDISRTQREIVFTIGAIAETRSRETGNHVKRVAEYSKLLALGYGLDETESELLKQASPMHDIGKVGIPDAILNKTGKHTQEEWDIMRRHAEYGYEMLRKSETAVLSAGATIALSHHEKWDGSGYPKGQSGADIHVYGRITALADVFDALGSDRCYKKAWPIEDVLRHVKEQRGIHFEPALVDILFAELDKFLAIREIYADAYICG